jgi:hypothetical protein
VNVNGQLVGDWEYSWQYVKIQERFPNIFRREIRDDNNAILQPGDYAYNSPRTLTSLNTDTDKCRKFFDEN